MLQRTLITAHISLLRFDNEDVEVFRDDVLPPTKKAFTRLRKDIDLTIREIGDSLGVGPMFIEATQSGYLECLDRERAAAIAGKMPPLQRTVSAKTTSVATDRGEAQDDQNLTGDDIAENLFNVSKRLQMEMETEIAAPAEYTVPSTPTHASTTAAGTIAVGSTGVGAKEKGSPISPTSPQPPTTQAEPNTAKMKYGPTMIRAHFEEFETNQKDILINILTSTDPGQNTVLKIHEPGPSVSELYGGDYLRGDIEEGDLPDLIAKRRKSLKNIAPMSILPLSAMQGMKSDEENPEQVTPNEEEANEGEDDDSSLVGPTPQFKRNETLVRVYSLLFAWEYVIIKPNLD
jgi:hypothetical protein